MKHVLLLALCLWLCAANANAAFIIKKQKEVAATEAAGNMKVQHYHKLSRFFSELSFRDWARPRTNGGEYNSGFAIASIILGGVAAICGAICLSTVYLADVLPAIAVIGLIAAILAVVFGTKGLKSQHKGLAIAGLSLGALTLIAASVAIILVSMEVITFL